MPPTRSAALAFIVADVPFRFCHIAMMRAAAAFRLGFRLHPPADLDVKPAYFVVKNALSICRPMCKAFLERRVLE